MDGYRTTSLDALFLFIDGLKNVPYIVCIFRVQFTLLHYLCGIYIET